MKAKELTIEEKAKAYDRALANAKEQAIDGYLDAIAVIDIFPELAESEDEDDEKIRKSIIEFVKQNKSFHYLLGVSKEDAVAWLEKQGNIQLPTFTFDDILALQCCMKIATANEYKELYVQLKSLHDRVYDAYRLEKQGEKKPIDLVAVMKDYFANTPKEQQDKDWEELKHLNNFGWELVKQKPAWSEEDEKSLLELSQCCDLNKTQVQWLLSLKDRVQPKQGWSEEDEELCEHLIKGIEELDPLPTSIYSDCKRWLKSLKDRYAWKPSDEQIYSLDRALRFYGKGTAVYDSVKELLEQLKKLKE